jgi:hypothetical protein
MNAEGPSNDADRGDLPRGWRPEMKVIPSGRRTMMKLRPAGVAAALLVMTACTSGGAVAATEPTATSAPSTTTLPTTVPTPTTAVEPESSEISIARAFFDARNAYDVEAATALFTPDVHHHGISVDMYPALFDWLRATAWRWTVDECHMKSGDANTSCTYQVENAWSRTIGLAPVQGAIYFEIWGGIRAVPDFRVRQLSEAWKTVTDWIRANHPTDVGSMISASGSGPVLDARSIDLWRLYTQEFVEFHATVAPDVETMISPRLAYDLEGDIYLADWDGGNAILIADGIPTNDGCGGFGGEGTMWAPVGRHFAYRSSWSDTCSGEVHVRDAQGLLVASVPGMGWDIGWSPDSTRYASWVDFWKTIGIYGLDGERQALLTVTPGCSGSGDFDSMWTPDGESVLVPPCKLPTDGGTPQRATAPESLVRSMFWRASWSPDGAHSPTSPRREMARPTTVPSRPSSGRHRATAFCSLPPKSYARSTSAMGT